MLFLFAMKILPARICVLIFLIIFSSCANIVPPTGGKKDTTPPKLVVVSPEDSLLNTRVTKIELTFDEFVTLDNASKEIQVSPVLPFPITSTLNGKSVIVEIPDSLLKERTTYRVSFGNAIKDLHEGNAFEGYNYMFSTTSYFDSLSLNGFVTNAATGTPATEGVIVLYEAEDNDSAVVRKKPLYVANIGSGGTFIIPGLPERPFRIYALVDKNENLVYDGEEEMIAFIDSVVVPVDSIKKPLQLRLFKELPIVDSLDIDSAKSKVPSGSSSKFSPVADRRRKEKAIDDNTELRYAVAVDTSNIEKRTLDITKPLKITFSQPIDTYSSDKVFITYDSSDVDVEADFLIARDTADTTNKVLLVDVSWKENTVYTVRLYKDFAKDTADVYALPSKHIFRTQSDDDYGKLTVHVPTAYYGNEYLLQVTNSSDTVHMEPVTDTMVVLKRLKPESYSISIIVDKNLNGKWDTGNLFEKVQPEIVIPHTNATELKAGWENVVDFVMPVAEGEEGATSPQKWDKPSPK